MNDSQTALIKAIKAAGGYYNHDGYFILNKNIQVACCIEFLHHVDDENFVKLTITLFEFSAKFNFELCVEIEQLIIDINDFGADFFEPYLRDARASASRSLNKLRKCHD